MENSEPGANLEVENTMMKIRALKMDEDKSIPCNLANQDFRMTVIRLRISYLYF